MTSTTNDATTKDVRALPGTVLVAAGLLYEARDGAQRVLVTQRKAGAHLEGLWEFPGGKVEPGEDPRDALSRELREELGIETRAGDVVEATFHRYPTKTVLLLFYEVARITGAEPRPLDVAALHWARLEDLEGLAFPPADGPVLAKVRATLAR